jgi:hypothetical protein
MYNKKTYIFFVMVLVLMFLFSLQKVRADVSETVTISAQVNSVTSGGGGNGGGGGGTNSGLVTAVNFSGLAYPFSKITILKNGVVAATTMADPAAKFSVSIGDLSTDTYTFSVFGQDSNNVKSLSFSFPVYVTSGTTVNIAGIFLSPTISIDKSAVKKGDTLKVLGQTVPESDVRIIFHSDTEIIHTVKTDTAGLYAYDMDTSLLEIGAHNVKSKTVISTDISATSPDVAFTVGSISLEKRKDTDLTSSAQKSDLNHDNRVNLVDFSIMAYWYKKPNPPEAIDLNHDGKIDLIDFSILAFNWTG